MKKIVLAVLCAAGMMTCVEAADAAVSRADLNVILTRLAKLEAENKAQAARIAELEAARKAQPAVAAAPAAAAPVSASVKEEGTTVNDSGRIWTTASGQKFFLADKAAGIFQPLSDNGLAIKPYGWLVLEGVYNSDYTAYPMYTDWVERKRPRHGGDTSTLSVNDSILGFEFSTPEAIGGWSTFGKFEFDLAGDDANHTDFHVRHLYWALTHEETGWEILFGQTWHLWKMVTPNEIDGAWMENTGHPYRRSPQIRVSKTFKDFWGTGGDLSARVGLVKNGPGMGGDRDGDGVQNNEQSAWCLFEGAVTYERKAGWEEAGRNWLVGVGGMYGRDKSRRCSAFDADGYPVAFDGPEDEYDSDLVMIAAQVPFLEKFTFTGQLFAGENLGGVQAGIGQTVGFRDLAQKGREVATFGGFADLRYDLNDKWAFAAGYGFDDPTDSDAEMAEQRIFNSRTYVDAFYQFNANLHFGLEYAYLTTDYSDGNGEGDNSSDDHRFQFTVYYDF